MAGIRFRDSLGREKFHDIQYKASKIMNALALLALMFGFTGMMLLDGQVFTHAMIGIVCGVVAAVYGVVLARRGREPRWTGWTFAVPGLALASWCGIASPSAYRFQEKFNTRSWEHGEKRDRQNQTPYEGSQEG